MLVKLKSAEAKISNSCSKCFCTEADVKCFENKSAGSAYICVVQCIGLKLEKTPTKSKFERTLPPFFTVGLICLNSYRVGNKCRKCYHLQNFASHIWLLYCFDLEMLRMDRNAENGQRGPVANQLSFQVRAVKLVARGQMCNALATPMSGLEKRGKSWYVT